MDGNWRKVGTVDLLKDGDHVGITIDGRELALYRSGNEWFCTSNICTHEDAFLTEGWFEGYVIECPLHAGRFDVRTGKGLCAPIERDIDTYAVRIEGEDVFVNAAPKTV